MSTPHLLLWIGSVVFYLCCIAHLGIRLAKSRNRIPILTKVTDVFRIMSDCCQPKPSSLETRSLRLVAKQQQELVCRCTSILFHVGGILTTFVYVAMLLKEPESIGVQEHLGVLPFFLVMGALSQVFKWYKMHGGVLFFLMGPLTGRMGKGLVDSNVDVAWVAQNTCLRCVAGIFVSSPWSATVLNLIGFTIDVILLHRQGGIDLFGENNMVTLAVNMIVTVLFFVLHNVWATGCRRTIEAEDAVRGETLVQTLLSKFCDAVVTLHADLRLARPAPKLTALLLQPGAPNGFHNKPFKDFVLDEDWAMLEALVSANSNKSQARAVQVRLKSGLGQTISCELHHVSSKYINESSAGEEINHLIGICELDNRLVVEVGNMAQGQFPSISEHIVNTNQDGCIQQGDAGNRNEACTTTLQHDTHTGNQGPGARHPISKEDQDTESEDVQDEGSTASSFGQISTDHNLVVSPPTQGKSRKPTEQTEENTLTSFDQALIGRDSAVAQSSATSRPKHTFMDPTQSTNRNSIPISTVEISWTQCNFQLLDASKKKVLEQDLLVSHEFLQTITDLGCIREFLAEYHNKVHVALQRMYRNGFLQQRPTGHVMKCRLGFSTSYQVQNLDVGPVIKSVKLHTSKQAAVAKHNTRLKDSSRGSGHSRASSLAKPVLRESL